MRPPRTTSWRVSSCGPRSTALTRYSPAIRGRSSPSLTAVLIAARRCIRASCATARSSAPGIRASFDSRMGRSSRDRRRDQPPSLTYGCATAASNCAPPHWGQPTNPPEVTHRVEAPPSLVATSGILTQRLNCMSRPRRQRGLDLVSIRPRRPPVIGGHGYGIGARSTTNRAPSMHATRREPMRRETSFPSTDAAPAVSGGSDGTARSDLCS